MGQLGDQQGDRESKSTAVAALVRVAAHHGIQFHADEMIRANQFDGLEPNSAQLRKMAERLGFRARLLDYSRGEIREMEAALPAILLLRDGKAVLLTRLHEENGSTRALLEDPLSAREITALVDEARLFEFWDGQALVLERPWKLTDEDMPFGFRWLIGQVMKERKLVRDIFVAALVMSLLSLFPIIAIMVLLDRVLTYHSTSTLGVVTLALILITAFEMAFGYLRRYMVMVATTRIDGRLNLYVYDKLLNLKMSFFERVPVGRIGAKLGQIYKVRSFFVTQIFGTLFDSVSLLILLPAMFYLNWRLSIFVITIALAILGIYIAFLPSLRRLTSVVIEAETAMGVQQVETIYGIKTIKSLSLEGLKRAQRDVRVAAVVESHQDLDRQANWPQTLVMPLERLFYAGTFVVGIYMALNSGNGATAGTIMAFALLAGRVTGPIVQMAGMLNAFEEARGAVIQVADVVNEPPEEGRSGRGLKAPIAGRVVFDNVRFKYSPKAPFALNGVSFEIPRGTIFGVMGRSGSGKTTVTRLLQGLNSDYEGSIKIDGMDLKQIDLGHLRANIGVVPQENFLFTGSIRENIGAARPNASFDRIVRAAQLAGAEEFIERLERGYDTFLEEGAVNLSGGQRQRIAIARALMVEPQILILDEATSALDAESEAIVNANLMRIAKDRTVIIISHRLSSLTDSDAILVLERGKFYDCGRHDDLLDRCDIYRSLWYQQNRHLDPNHARTSGRPTTIA